MTKTWSKSKFGRPLVLAFGSESLALQFREFRTKFNVKNVEKKLKDLYGIRFQPGPDEPVRSYIKITSGGSKTVYRSKAGAKDKLFSITNGTLFQQKQIFPEDAAEIAVMAFYIANINKPIANQFLKFSGVNRRTGYERFKIISEAKALLLKSEKKEFEKASPKKKTELLMKRLFEKETPIVLTEIPKKSFAEKKQDNESLPIGKVVGSPRLKR